MKKIIVILLLLTATGIFFSRFTGELYSAPKKLADSQYASSLCNSWNNSRLPYLLGTETAKDYRGKKIKGSDWIHSLGKKDGKQKIVSGRSDCKGWSKIQLVIEKDADGLAKCISGGAYNGAGLTWQFIPSTANWFEFARSFGMGAFYSLWRNGMIGSKTTAWSNRKNFGYFFRLSGRLALNSDWETGCSGLKKDDVKEEIEDLKKAWRIK